MMATIFLTVYGKQGLRELAEHNLAKADYLSSALTAAGSAPKLLFQGAPRFHEFVVEHTASAEETNAALLEHKIIGGLPLARWYPELGPNASLWCATELTTRAQMDAAAASLRAIPSAELTRA
jgi:glycine dehydrogenase subunit 1